MALYYNKIQKKKQIKEFCEFKLIFFGFINLYPESKDDIKVLWHANSITKLHLGSSWRENAKNFSGGCAPGPRSSLRRRYTPPPVANNLQPARKLMPIISCKYRFHVKKICVDLWVHVCVLCDVRCQVYVMTNMSLLSTDYNCDLWRNRETVSVRQNIIKLMF